MDQEGTVKIEKPTGHNDFRNIPKPYVDLAKKIEGEFAKLMVEQMKKSVDKNEEDSSAMDFYDSLMTQEQSTAMVGKEGLGVSKLILDQIYPQRLRTEENLRAFENKQRRPYEQN